MIDDPTLTNQPSDPRLNIDYLQAKGKFSAVPTSVDPGKMPASQMRNEQMFNSIASNTNNTPLDPNYVDPNQMV